MLLARAISPGSHSTRRLAALAFALSGALIAAPGCSSDDSTAAPGTDGGAGGSGNCPAGGGPLPGTAPDRCMGTFQDVAAECIMGEPEGGVDTDAGVEPLPDPAVGRSDADDDCKYMVSFANDCVQQGGTGTTFTVTLKSLTQNMAPVTGSTSTYIEAFLNMNHPAPSGGGNATETMPGVYKFEPLKFDAAGKWTVRFHFFGNCSDVPEDAPHSHRAFFINVP